MLTNLTVKDLRAGDFITFQGGNENNLVIWLVDRLYYIPIRYSVGSYEPVEITHAVVSRIGRVFTPKSAKSLTNYTRSDVVLKYSDKINTAKVGT